MQVWNTVMTHSGREEETNVGKVGSVLVYLEFLPFLYYCTVGDFFFLNYFKIIFSFIPPLREMFKTSPCEPTHM